MRTSTCRLRARAGISLAPPPFCCTHVIVQPAPGLARTIDNILSMLGPSTSHGGVRAGHLSLSVPGR